VALKVATQIKEKKHNPNQTNNVTNVQCPHWLKPLPFCPCGHTINFKKSEVFASKVSIWRSPSPCPHWTNPPSWLWTSFMDSSFAV